ncbi:N-acyl-D-amino-acid deacylase family protein [Uniformispora flossi]|uniref:N-acyl-D-amino-acid deacylase family protein n=1 Tax=Uniformispora flossi TaxID=3390723 RepID=UPI003C2F3B98
MGDLLVRGGTVVDGTSAPGYRADVRIREGRIVEIGPELPRAGGGEQVIDADGAVVAPGFIEAHTHVDGHMWWNPDLDPLPAYGVTTVVMGNCGMSVAPLSAEARGPVLDLFCFLEDLPLSAFHQDVPWNWERWPEYRTAVQGQATSVNVAGFVGHLTLRTTVMGGDAAWSREATAAEIARMAELLDEALGHGAIGLSTNLFDKDRYLRLVPTRLAADEEFAELVAVLARHTGATLQMITRFNDPENVAADVERLAAICRPRGVRAQWTSIPSTRSQSDLRDRNRALHRRLRATGADMWPNVQHVPLEPFFNFERALTFQRVPAWNEWMNSPMETKLATLADPEWRDRARDDWDKRERAATSRLDRPESLILELSETGQGPLGISLQDYADREGLHISDALATWLIANGLRSCLRGTPEAFDEPAVAELFKDPHVLTNINDSGAHLQLFCGAGHNLYLLTHYVRDAGLLTLEEGVHNLTGKLAGYFGMGDRGTIAVGQAGDLVVFALDEIEVRPVRKSYDNPDGSWRFTRDPSGIRATVVSGVPTVLDTAPTATRPGTMVGRAAR